MFFLGCNMSFASGIALSIYIAQLLKAKRILSLCNGCAGWRDCAPVCLQCARAAACPPVQRQAGPHALWHLSDSLRSLHLDSPHCMWTLNYFPQLTRLHTRSLWTTCSCFSTAALAGLKVSIWEARLPELMFTFSNLAAPVDPHVRR